MNAELVSKIRNCPNLPSLPAIAVQVLDLAGKPSIDIGEIARIISKDPALSGKILKTVNSSFYGRSHAISTISHSLVVLGLQSVKTLVLTFSLVTNLSKVSGKGFKHITYWKRSIYSATAARTIATKVNLVQQEEAFLAALLCNIGMLVLESVLGDEYGEIYARAATHQELFRAEQEALGMTHAEVGALLAEEWKLPPVLASPIAHSHSADTVTDPALRRVAEVVELAGMCGDVFAEKEAGAAIQAVRKTCATRHQMNDTECDALLAEIGDRTKEVAGLFEINIGTYGNYEAILAKASERMVELTLQTQQRATELEAQNQELKHQATTDGLTSLSNRALFDAFLGEAYASVAAGKPLSLLMLDLDKFKSINDTHGHQVGDAVIKAVAAVLKSAGRAQDLAARYGGEEMALVLPNTPRATAALIADTIRRTVEANPVKTGGKTVRVTVSIGVATAEAGGPLTNVALLIKAADMAVYAAKRGGRNCVKVFAVRGSAAA